MATVYQMFWLEQAGTGRSAVSYKVESKQSLCADNRQHCPQSHPDLILQTQKGICDKAHGRFE